LGRQQDIAVRHCQRPEDKRQTDLREQIRKPARASDLMVICAEAGLSLDATLVRVSRELGNTWPELAEEFGITAAELTFLPERRMPFDNLNARTDSDGIRGVVNTLQQTARFGTPLAQLIPMMIFILPTLFIVLLGPAAINVMDTFRH